MSSKHKKHAPGHITSAELKARVERALHEGRSQQALDLARQLYKREHTPEYQELVKKASLARARHLHEQGYNQDAATLLETAVQIDPDNPAWLQTLAEPLARCGGIQKALALVSALLDVPARAKIQAHAADAALQQKGGRALVPAAMQPDFDRIIQAFREVETGQDDKVRTTLQGIGLRSPFLEWKLLLRGLQAYYLNDDPRALENWQRLDPERLPARLAAPFRAQIDPAFRSAQPPATQTALHRQIERLQASTVVQQLRSLRSTMAGRNGLAAAFRQLDGLLPVVRQQAPQLVPRLARFFYWAMLKTGPDDILRYRRIFGAPADDPNFHRLQAVALERGSDLEGAHEAWKDYEKEVARFPWPAEEVKRARALIWLHMGENAQQVPSKKQVARMPAFLRDYPDRPEPLDPPAEKCFRKSLELAPDLLPAHEALFQHEIHEERLAHAIKAGQALLEKFPDHVPTLEKLAKLFLDKEKPQESLELLQRALKNNPLNRQLRSQVATAHLHCARAAVEAREFDEARRHYQLALEFEDRQRPTFILCKQAACEFKAGETARAEKLVQEARSGAPSALAVSFSMLIEVSRLKLPKPLKTRFEKEFTEGLGQPAQPVDVVELVELAMSHHVSGVQYTGSKTHFKKVQTYAEKARTRLAFTEDQLERICQALIGLEAGVRSIKGYLRLGQTRYHNNPVFDLLEMEFEAKDSPDLLHVVSSRYRMEEITRKISALPEGPRKESLQKRMDQLKQLIDAMSPLGGMPFPPFFDIFDPFGDDDDDDER